MFLVPDVAPAIWTFISRFGEAQILLPVALGLALLLWRRGDSSRLALAWTGWIVLVASITTVSKLAFIGWGVGSARRDFTGFSGHVPGDTAGAQPVGARHAQQAQPLAAAPGTTDRSVGSGPRVSRPARRGGEPHRGLARRRAQGQQALG